MKKTIISAALCLAVLGVTAQSFIVYLKNGEKVGFNNAEVESIDFSTENLPEVKSFSSIMTSISPNEGNINLEQNEWGVGKFDIEFSSIVALNSSSTESITLSRDGDVIYSADVNSDALSLQRNYIGYTSSLIINFNNDGEVTPGSYTLSIPEGFLTVDEATVGSASFAYVIPKPAPAQTLTVSPTPGEVESIGTVEYKYDNYNVSSLNGTPSAYIYKEGETNPVQMVSISLEDGAFSITADPAITSPGIYTITIPENSFKLTDPTSESDVVYDSEKISTVYQIIGQENEELPDPQIGDFYYSDGTWSSTLVNKTDATPIGVVFYVGIASDYKDNATLYKVKDGSAALEDFHGYVVALHDATYFDESNHTCTWSAFNSNDPGCGCSTNTSDFLGYSNTLSIKAHAGTELSANSDSYPAAYYATDFFESQVPAPAQSSGWFLPSAYQLKYIYDRVYFELAGSSTATVENSLKALADYGGAELYVRDSEYWTSTEYVDSYGCSYRAYYMCFDYSNFSPGFVTWSNKNRERRVRSILAF